MHHLFANTPTLFRRFLLLLALVLIPANLLAFEEYLQQLVEISRKKNTLAYLRDERSKKFFSALLAGLPKASQKNFKANITGDYAATLLANWGEKENELGRLLAMKVRDEKSSAPTILNFVEGLSFPDTTIFYQPLREVYAALLAEPSPETEPTAKAILAKINQIKKTSKNDIYPEIAALYSKTKIEDFPLSWFDDENYDPTYSTGEGEATLLTNNKDHRLNLNLCSAEELINVPGLGATLANAILAKRPFQSVDELQKIAGISPSKFTQIKDLFFIPTTTQPRKKWTVMVYLGGDNNLERAAIADINEMESVGSNDQLNIVVQADRSRGNYSIANGNWNSTRRYYITPDLEPTKITSPIREELGEVDMGKPEALENFGKWAITHFPADHYLLVVWSHGAGWPGIAPEEEEGQAMDILELSGAVANISKALKAQDSGKSKIDIVDFDACLMGMIEVGYELSDAVDILVASQEVEPGQGMPYGDYLKKIVEDPNRDPETISKFMVSSYVKSYAKGGSATSKGRTSYTGITKSAYRLSKIKEFVGEWNQLAKLLITDRQKLHLQETLNGMDFTRYQEATFGDTMGFLLGLKENPAGGVELQQQVGKILTLYGHPRLGEDIMDLPVVVTAKQPGWVVWGLNGWKRPPNELFPSMTEVYKSRFARTRLMGPTREGTYFGILGPFASCPSWSNPQKMALITEVNYRIESMDGETSPDQKVAYKADHVINHQTPSASPLIIEGHSRGMGNSHGLSVYLPNGVEYRKSYSATRFAKDTLWDEVISEIPTFKRTAKLLVLGLDPSQKYLVKILKAFKVKFDYLETAGIYKHDYAGILSQYQKDGVVLTSLAPIFKVERQYPKFLADYATNGGKLLYFNEGYLEYNLFTDFFKRVFGVEYGSEIKTITSLLADIDPQSRAAIHLVNGDLLAFPALNLEEGTLPILKDGQDKVLAADKAGRMYISVPVDRLTEKDLLLFFQSLFKRAGLI